MARTLLYHYRVIISAQDSQRLPCDTSWRHNCAPVPRRRRESHLGASHCAVWDGLEVILCVSCCGGEGCEAGEGGEGCEGCA